MNEYDVAVFENAGFRLITKGKVDYCDDEFAASYLRWGFEPPEEVERETAFAVEKMNLTAGKRVLDIGSGNGVAAVKMSEMGLDVTAIDISPVFIEAAKKLERERELVDNAGEITWICCDFFKYKGVLHDAATLLDAGLDVVNDPFMLQLSEVLKPGGYFSLRYKQGIGGATNWPWSKWEYRPNSASFIMEHHTIDQLSGKTADEWVTIDFAEKRVVVERSGGGVSLFSDFVERMAKFGFGLTGAWSDVKGSPVTESSRIYPLFAKRK